MVELAGKAVLVTEASGVSASSAAWYASAPA